MSTEPDPKAENTTWTESRHQELTKLIQLIRECASINSSNQIVSKLQKIEEIAKELDRGDMSRSRWRFTMFLEQLAMKDVKPPAPAKEGPNPP